MYLNKDDIRALKVVMKNVENVARTTSKNARAIKQLSRVLQQNKKRVQKQQREIKYMTSVPRNQKCKKDNNNNNIW